MIDLLRKRRSIRKYSEKDIEKEKLEILKETAVRSPSSKNINPWEFIFVDDKEIISQLKGCKPHGVTPLKTAPLAVVICADETKNDVWIEDCSIASICCSSLHSRSGWEVAGFRFATACIPKNSHLKNTFRIYWKCLKTSGYSVLLQLVILLRKGKENRLKNCSSRKSGYISFKIKRNRCNQKDFVLPGYFHRNRG